MNARRPTHDLDTLARATAAELGALYDAAGTPGDLHALDGHPTGRMLAVLRLDRGLAARAIARFARSRRFFWGGKSFGATAPGAGVGINRVKLGGRHALFPFRTHFGDSRLDGRPCVILDYDLPDNPAIIRAIHDEVREVSPGVYLGPAMAKVGAEARLVLWFALDTTRQCEPLVLP